MKMVLAQYTIRSKQEYIFRTNRMVEIAGASENISQSWNILFTQADKMGKKLRRVSENIPFCMEEVKRLFDERKLNGIELFCGGGNDTVLYDSIETYLEVNKAFSRFLLENYPGMIPMAVACEYSGDYDKDYANLMKQSDIEKNKMISGQSDFILPFSMMDRTTFQPYSDIISIAESSVRVTDEAKAKRKAGLKIREQDETVKLLDDLITKKGEESLLAVVHADGNNMGSKISEMLTDKKDYDSCVNIMREFTADTAKAFGKSGLDAMQKCQQQLKEDYKDKYDEKAFFFRKIIADGDDMTFVCNARFVMDYVGAYLEAAQNYNNKGEKEWRYSSCAGICIFHSHYPFARAYSLAEQACESAKKNVHGECIKEESWIDFHYIHNGVGGDLDQIREHQGVSGCMARPWRIGTKANTDRKDYSTLQILVDIMKENGVSRSDIKTIGSELEDSYSYGKFELNRVYGHHRNLQNEIKEKLKIDKEEDLLPIIYDLSEVYDLWFVRK
jgi:hypothetical protein